MYEFSLSSLFLGLLIVAVGIVFVRYYQWVADNFGSGVSSYDRFKLVAIIVCVVGLIVMTNLHVVILRAIFTSIFPSLHGN